MFFPKFYNHTKIVARDPATALVGGTVGLSSFDVHFSPRKGKRVNDFFHNKSMAIGNKTKNVITIEKSFVCAVLKPLTIVQLTCFGIRSQRERIGTHACKTSSAVSQFLTAHPTATYH
uniref:Uncharacterized protein n=1 Tax=Globodera rostochiensis TaxID=31243 RepID=A0A914H4D3_GLORO